MSDIDAMPSGFAWIPLAEEPEVSEIIEDLNFAFDGHSTRIIWSALVYCLADCYIQLPAEAREGFYAALPDVFVGTVERLTKLRQRRGR